MPGDPRSVELTNRYRNQVRLLRERAATVAASMWREIDPAHLDETHARWASMAALRVTEMQRAAATLSTAYLTGYVALERGRPARAIGASAAADVGRSRDGKTLRDSLEPTLYTTKAAIAEGRTFSEALALGAQRAARNLGEDVAFVARGVLDEGIIDNDEIIGWRRVSGGGCGACLAAATGAIQADDETLPVHDHCQCSKEPVVRGVRERVLRPSGEEIFHRMTASQQDALFAGRGGAEKADLIRSGQVPFQSLIEHQHMDAIPDVITEASLKSLEQHL